MMFEEDDTKYFLKYLPDKEQVLSTAKLTAIKDPTSRDLLALTNSSILKYKKIKNHETLNQIYLRHVVGLNLELDVMPLARLITGIVFAGVGGGFLFFLLTSMVLVGVFVGIPCLVIGIILIIQAVLRTGGLLQIVSNNSETPFVEASFSGLQQENVLQLVKALQTVLKL